MDCLVSPLKGVKTARVKTVASLDAVADGSRFLLTCAFPMTSSHSKAVPAKPYGRRSLPSCSAGAGRRE